MRNAVSLCNARFHSVSCAKMELPSDYKALGVFLVELSPEVLGFYRDLGSDGEVLAVASPRTSSEALVTRQVALRPLLEGGDLLHTLEHVRVHHRDAHEHDASKVPLEHAEKGEERVAASPP